MNLLMALFVAVFFAAAGAFLAFRPHVMQQQVLMYNRGCPWFERTPFRACVESDHYQPLMRLIGILMLVMSILLLFGILIAYFTDEVL